MNDNINLALNLLVALGLKATEISRAIRLANAENRDLTTAELHSLQAADDAARADLQAAIARAESEGR